MLGRVVLLARLRPHTFPPAVRLAVSKPHIIARGYARERKIPADYKLPSNARLPGWQQQQTPPQRAQPSSEESQAKDYHVAQGQEAVDELNARAEQQPAEDHHAPQGQNAARGLNDQAASESDLEPEPQKPLPDLRHGIPSTLDAELNAAHSRHEASTGDLNITEDPSQPPLGTSGRGSDGLPRSSYISSSDRKKNTAFKYVYLTMALGSIGYVIYLGRNWVDEEEEKKYADAPSGWGVGLFYNRVKARLSSQMEYYSDPVFTKLLPDEDKDPTRRFPFVLVLSLDDMLIHSEWTRETGWRIAKRPGLDYFLRYLCQYYEIVLFTSQPSAMAAQVYQKLDPFRIIQWPLYREATLYKDGGYIKDLSYLNRPLNKVLMIDTDAHHAKNQPENAIILPKWTGDPKDKTLVELIPFLEYLATMGFDDSRKVLKSFEGTYIPAEFARREKLLRQKFEAAEAEKRGTRPKRSLGSLFSTKQPNADGLDSMAEGKMLWDQIREKGQKQFEALDKQIKEEGAKWLEEEAKMQKQMEEDALKEMKSKGPLGWFNFGGTGEEKK